MDKLKRGELLRFKGVARAIKKPYCGKGASCSESGAEPQKLWKPYLTTPVPVRLDSNPFGRAVSWKAAPWIKKPDKVKKPKPSVKRIERVSPLILIAARYPLRLPRRHD